jgi:hypothetical protein
MVFNGKKSIKFDQNEGVHGKNIKLHTGFSMIFQEAI